MSILFVNSFIKITIKKIEYVIANSEFIVIIFLVFTNYYFYFSYTGIYNFLYDLQLL